MTLNVFRLHRRVLVCITAFPPPSCSAYPLPSSPILQHRVSKAFCASKHIKFIKVSPYQFKVDLGRPGCFDSPTGVKEGISTYAVYFYLKYTCRGTNWFKVRFPSTNDFMRQLRPMSQGPPTVPNNQLVA